MKNETKVYNTLSVGAEDEDKNQVFLIFEKSIVFFETNQMLFFLKKWNFFLLACCIVASLASFSFGFNIGVTNLPTPVSACDNIDNLQDLILIR
jgi:hypothetical protein